MVSTDAGGHPTPCGLETPGVGTEETGEDPEDIDNQGERAEATGIPMAG